MPRRGAGSSSARARTPIGLPLTTTTSALASIGGRGRRAAPQPVRKAAAKHVARSSKVRPMTPSSGSARVTQAQSPRRRRGRRLPGANQLHDYRGHYQDQDAQRLLAPGAKQIKEQVRPKAGSEYS